MKEQNNKIIKSKEEFNRHLKQGLLALGEFFFVEVPISINDENLPNDRGIFIRNITFKHIVNINIHNDSLQLSFDNCDFKDKLRADRIELEWICIEQTKIRQLLINKSTFSHKMIIYNNCFIEDINIFNSRFINFLKIDYSEVGSFSCSGDEMYFYSFEITQTKIKNRLEFNSSSIYSFKIEGTEIGSLWIRNSKIKKIVRVFKSKIKKVFTISGNALNFLYLENNHFNDVHLLLSKEGYQKYKNKGPICTYNRITLINNVFDNKLLLDDPRKDKDKISIKSLNIGLNIVSKGEIRIKDINIDHFTLNGRNYESEITIDNSKINQLFISSFSNYKTLSFFRLRPINKTQYLQFIINKSNLGKTQFHYCDLAAYKDNIEIDQTSLVDIIPTGVNWFTYKDLKESNSKDKENRAEKIINAIGSCCYYTFYNDSKNHPEVKEYKKFRELFRQLKTVMDRQANRIQALQFKQYEMQAYRKELIHTKNLLSRERFILWANQSNNHGQNWLKPILLAIGFSIILISFITFSVYEDWWSLEVIGENIKHYPRMMNPAFSLKSIFGESKNFSFGANLWALLQRISMSFFIYQTVVAFRKYGKG